jgi:hypothetical protein
MSIARSTKSARSSNPLRCIVVKDDKPSVFCKMHVQFDARNPRVTGRAERGHGVFRVKRWHSTVSKKKWAGKITQNLFIGDSGTFSGRPAGSPLFPISCIVIAGTVISTVVVIIPVVP